MVAHLIRLKLRLMVNGWRRSTMQLVFTVIGLAYLAGMLGVLSVGMFALAGESVQVRGTALVLAMSVAVVLWLVIPVFVSGVDPTLDPVNFVTFGIPPRTLVVGLLLAGTITLAGLGTALGLLATVAAWRDHPWAAAAAGLGAVLGTLFCVALSYAVTGLLASVAGRRRVRETLSLIAMVPLVLAGLIISQVADSIAQLWDRLPQIASVLAWTPLGSFTALPWTVAEGRLGEAAALLGLCLLWLAGALGLWMLAIRRSVESRGGAGATASRSTGLGLIGRTPATPAGAVMARSLIYWFKDPRYSASLVMLPALLLLFWFLGQQDGTYGLLLALGPITGFMLGYAISADISYDGSAFALHVTSGVSGRDDRIGRIAALLVWAVPATLLITIGSCALANEWAPLPGLLGLAFGALLAGAAVSALVSARFIYPVPPPGASPFATPQGAMMRIMLVQLASMAVTVVLVLPELVLFIVALVTGDPLFHWLTLGVGLVLGAVLVWLGIRLGGRWFDRAQAETYQQVLRHA